MIINNTDHLEQIYEHVKDLQTVGNIDTIIDLTDSDIIDYQNERITTIRNYAFDTCKSLRSIDFANVTSIGTAAFANCSNLTSVNLPSATYISQSGFVNCSNLTSVNLPKVTSIGSSAFNDTKLQFIDLPSVTYIGDNALYRGPLKTLILRSSEVCKLYNANSINAIKINTGYIYVPRVLIEDYKVANYWSTYASQFRAIEDYPDICG